MLSRASHFAIIGAASASHYEKPPCQSDEIAGQIASGAQLCAPKCDASGTCPNDVPVGVKAIPQCALKTTTGDKYCALVCKADTECPTGGKCTKPMPFLPTGVCTYAAGGLQALNGPQRLFEEFAAVVGRIYLSDEERAARFKIFQENMMRMESLQKLDAGAVYTHKSPFADWTRTEFAARNSLRVEMFRPMQDAPLRNTSALPGAFDWRSKGAVNAVKNQEQCGSCWAFSTVANIEGVNFLATNKLLSLSEQQLVDCDHNGDQGCNGGLPSNAMQFLIQTKTGLESESAYPYTARDGSCQAVASKELAFITSWTKISSDEDQMAAALMQHGPLSIGINAGPMQMYGGGVSDPSDCDPSAIDHGVAIVAFGSEPKNYWTIRNSWGATWGEEGYYRIVRGSNACGLASMVTTAIIQNDAREIVV